MASMMDGPKEDEARLIVLEQKEESAYCMTIKEDKGKNGEGEWYSDIVQYLKDGTYPKSANKNDQLTFQRLSTNYIIYGATPYSLVYGMEAVFPIEISVCSPRTISESEILEADWLQSRYDQLCMLDEERLKALYHIQGYYRRLREAFDKKVRVKDLKLGDLVLKEI
ncbi:uncharacterized protein LOC136067858 [Quercus suber]|uniref:uncharacterized protein LOC136067858 n=1 Tax=Quercus suber TaxID=58331 RepID=UPI0032DE5BEE